MNEIALHYQVAREELFDSYEMTVRPPDIPDGTAPLLIHLVNDFPHGNDMVLVLVDLEVHGSHLERHYHTTPDTQRRVYPVPKQLTQLTREALLILTDTFDYCRFEHLRCLVEVNYSPWFSQHRSPRHMVHGDYVKIIIPPPEYCETGTQELLNDSRAMSVEEFWNRYYIPTSPVNESNATASNVSPSLIASEDIKREFGPSQSEEDDEHSQMQTGPGRHEPASSSSAPAVGTHTTITEVQPQRCLLSDDILDTRPWPLWFRILDKNFADHARVENDQEGPVAYFDTWYADCRAPQVTEVSRPLRLDRMLNLWQEDIRHVWRDKTIVGEPVYVVSVMPSPPLSPLSRSAGHLIVFQFPNEGFVPFILSFQFVALNVQGFSHALVICEPHLPPLEIVNRVNMHRVCHGRKCTLHRGKHGAKWTDPIFTGENIRLVVPPHGARAHLDILSYPAGVEIVQTGPAEFDFCISMRIEDHPPQIQALHEVWSRNAVMGPADTEQLLEVTTWYLDAQHVPYNDDSRKTFLGEDFFSWEQQLRDLWGDLADASLELSIHFVSPIPGDSPLGSIHLLLLQQFDEDQIGSVVSIYDNAARRNGPFSTAAALPTMLHRRDILVALGRQFECEDPAALVHCSTWLSGLEIVDSRPFTAQHGQNFNLQVHRMQLHGWGEGDIGDDDEANMIQLSLQSRLRFSDSSGSFRPIAQHLAKDQTNLLQVIPHPSLTAALPTCIELQNGVACQEVHDELQKFGFDLQAVVFDCLTAAFVWNQMSQDEIVLIFIEKENFDQSRYAVRTVPTLPHRRTVALMEILHSMGCEKAVILAEQELSQQIIEILFTIPVGHFKEEVTRERAQRPWPPHQPVLTPGPLFRPANEALTSCLLSLGVTIEEVNALFISSTWELCHTLESIELPECSQEACNSLSNDSSFDRLVIYTDGSSHSGFLHKSPLFIDECAIPDAWAFLVLGEKYQADGRSSLTLVGWMAHQVRYQPDSSAFLGAKSANPLIAEREAMIWAFLWRIFQNTNLPTVFRTDSWTTKGQAEGTVGASECDLSFQLLRGCYQLLETALPSQALQISHIYGHQGEPWNELVDALAKQEARSSFYLKRPEIDLHEWKHLLPHLWLLFAEQFGAPIFVGNGFHVPPPNLPDLPSVSENNHAVTRQTLVKHTLSFATANVLSLGKPDQGFAGKLHFIRSQFASLRLNFLGIQEARSDEGSSSVGGILRLCSGGHHGTLGVELWCNLHVAIGYADKVPIFLNKSHFNVAVKDPRRLLVHVACPLQPFWILVAHAPHSGKALAERRDWWLHTQNVVEQVIRPEEQIFVCVDANAPPGDCDHRQVFTKGFSTTTGTQFLREFMSYFDLCAPSTSELHHGPVDTWTTPDGSSSHVIDFVLVPVSLMSAVTWSQLLENFDLGNCSLDHTPVALDLQWCQHRPSVPQENLKRPGIAFDRTCIQKADLGSFLGEHRVPDWSCEVDKHFEHIKTHFLDSLQQHCPKRSAGPKKPYMSDEIWELRAQKLTTRKALKELKRRTFHDLLGRAFKAWSNEVHPNSFDSLDDLGRYAISLRCYSVHLMAKFSTQTRKLRDALRQAKSIALDQTLQTLPKNAAAGDIQRALRSFMGPSNKLRQGMPPLPAIRNENHELCVRGEDTINRWVEYFADIEGGVRLDPHTQMKEWIDNLAQISSCEFSIPITEMPTLCELEFALRQMKPGKASGPDGIPSELCRFFPGPVAKQMYTLLLKAAIQGHEPLALKGGTALPIWKGKKAKDVCNAFRSILLSSNIGKAMHKTMRSKQSLVYESFLQHQQLGGRKKVPVVLGTHMTKAFLRSHHAKQHSTAILFVDLEAAFYKVVRPLALSGRWDDEILASMAQRLRMPADTIHALYEHLKEPGATETAGMPQHARRALQAVHQDTFFQVPHQTDAVKTHLGTRPGDAYADVVFGYLMARILHRFTHTLQDRDVLSSIPVETGPQLFHQVGATPTEHMVFTGPVWMDDIALCLWGNTNDAVAAKLGVACGTLLDLFKEHAMRPNLSKGKTEVMFSVRGPKTHIWKKRLYGPLSTGHFAVLGEVETFQVPIVTNYIHLGSHLHHSGASRPEAKRRIAIANSSFNQHRKLIFQNEHLALHKRVEIFSSLIISKLCYAAETWILKDWKTREYVHSAIIRLYKRLLHAKEDSHLTDEEILCRLQLPSPTELLRRCRLRYLATLMQIGPAAGWGLLNQDSEWLLLLQDDLQWMWAQLANSSDLGDPSQHLARWLEVMEHHRPYWRRLVRRASQHAIKQRLKNFQCHQFYCEMRQLLQSHDAWHPLVQPEAGVPESDAVLRFGCMKCRKAFRSRGGEGAHMFRKHGEVQPVRYLINSTQCGACLKEYFTHGKMKMHLLRSSHCRAYLLAGPWR